MPAKNSAKYIERRTINIKYSGYSTHFEADLPPLSDEDFASFKTYDDEQANIIIFIQY